MGIMKDLIRADPKHMELHDELHDESKKELRQHWFILDFQKAGWQKQWSVTAPSEMCKTFQQKAKRLMNVCSIHHLMGRLFFFFEQKYNSTLYLRTYQGRVHQFGTQILPGILMGYALNVGGGWTGDV